MMPEPNRPDIDAPISATCLLNELSQEIGAAIDWSSSAIYNLAPVAGWLTNYEGQHTISCLFKVETRNLNSKSEPIRSWKYFESEILAIGKIKDDETIAAKACTPGQKPGTQ
jgi:hypothetical protein